MKKTLYLMLGVLFLLMSFSGNAIATPVTPFSFDTTGGTGTGFDGTLLNVGVFDWSPASGLGVDTNALGPTGFVTPTNLLYQSFATAILDPNSQPLVTAPVNLNVTYQLSATASVWENRTVVLNTGTSAIETQTLNTSHSNVIDVYFDTNTGTFVDVAAGTGFNDGIHILSADVKSLSGVFFLNDTNGNGIIDNLDTGVGSVDLISKVTFFDSNYFPTFLPGMEILTHFIGTVNTPPEGVDTVMMYDGTVPNYFGMPASIGGPGTPFNTTDFMFKVDGNSHFSVPEPGTLILLGSGLLGLAFSAGRRKK